MQPEGPARSHFFDDDDISISFAFQKPEDSHQKALELPLIFKDLLTMKTNQADVSTSSLYGLNQSLMIQYKDESDSDPNLILDLCNSRLKLLNPDEKNPDYGFSVTKNGNCFEFYCQNKQTATNWYDALKKICILTSFHDDYKAIKMIGRGSFAKVYLVESKENGKSYAVKAFTKDSMAVSNKANAKPSMLNEIGLMRTINHENIIKLYEVYETEKSIYLVLELIQGKSLYDVLKKSNREEITPTKIINMVRSLLDALAYLASKGIMHRDLKPDNILLDRGEKVKLVDFGLATVVDVPVYIFKKCGTPGYIAPEVFKFDDKDPATGYNDRCDVFSVGCLLYYMLFGTPFFGGSTAADILKLNRKFAADFPVLNTIKLETKSSDSKISKDGLNLLIDLLEYDCKKRISATQALGHPYFIPVPSGMQKIAGTNEFYIDALSKFNENDIYSPCSPLKLTSLPMDQVYSPLTPLRFDPLGGESPLLANNKDRFVKEDSLYLDLGKPEINGRMDTITSGSTNNSLLLANRTDSSNNIASPCLSTFGNKSLSRANSKSFKSYAQSASNQSFLKAAIFRNMQKNNSEGLKEEETVKNKLSELKATRNSSELSPTISPTGNFETEEIVTKTLSDSPEKRNIENEEVETPVANQNSRLQMSGKLHLITNSKYPSKVSNAKPKKFQPFASGNLNIQKNPIDNNA